MSRDLDKMCGGKNRYDDKKAAISQINRIMRGRHRVKKLRAYPCPNCRGWHLSSH